MHLALLRGDFSVGVNSLSLLVPIHAHKAAGIFLSGFFLP